MTATEALQSICEDIERLEAKQLLPPGIIRRRRAEAKAIADELAAHAMHLQAEQQKAEELRTSLNEARTRAAMLAHMLVIYDIRPHPLTEPLHMADQYARAARLVLRLRHDRPGGPNSRRRCISLADLDDSYAHAMLWAVLDANEEELQRIVRRSHVLQAAYKKIYLTQ